MIAKRVVRDGRVLIEVNGEALPPVAFMTYCGDSRRFQQFQEAGIRFVSFGAYATDYGINDFSGLSPFGPNFWIGENEYIFDEIDRTLEMVAPTGSGVYIFPRVYLDCPKWWAKKHPGELCKDNRGETLRQSFASEKWREDAWHALQALIDHLNASKWKECIVGYHIAAGSTEEWTYHNHSDLQFRMDYSEPNRQKYIGWLIEKYGSIEELNKSWNKHYDTFEKVQFPTLMERLYAKNGVLRDCETEMPVIDFWDYTSWIFADTIIYFCQKVKEYTNNTRLAGAFYGYVMLLTKNEKGHFALHKVLESPHVDFVASTNGDTDPGLSWAFGSAVDSARLHGKLFFAEGDIRTCKSTKMSETMPHAVSKNQYYTSDVWRPLPSMDLTMSILRKAGLRVLTGQTGVWWFDMFGGWFDAPEMMDFFTRFKKLMDVQTIEPLKPEVAVIVDEGGLKHLRRDHSPAWQIINVQRTQLNWMGAPYHCYLAEDLASENFPVDEYKLYIMLDFVRPDEKVRRAVKEKLQKGGRTLVWTYFSDVDHGGELTGFESIYDKTAMPARGSYHSEYNFGSAVFPGDAVSCPRFTPEVINGAYPLANFEGTTEPCVLMRQYEEYASVCSLLPALPAPLLADLLLLGNAHRYIRTEDVVYAGGQFVGIHAKTAGEKRLYLPFAVKELVDAETGKVMELHNDIYTDFQMREFETRMFRIVK